MDSRVRGVGFGDSPGDGGFRVESPAGTEELSGAEEFAGYYRRCGNSFGGD